VDLNDLRYFALIVEHGGFSAAERHAHITKSKLSRRVRLLEEGLGVRLLQRSTRRMVLTEAGRIFYEHCAAMVVEADSARHAVEQLRSEPAGTVRLTCPQMLAQFYVTRLVADFMRRYPKVRVELESNDRRINLIRDSPIELIENGFDIALIARESSFSDASLVTRRIAQGRFVLVASPAYVARKPPIEELQQLASHDTIGALRDGPEQLWKFVAAAGPPAEVSLRPRFLCSDYSVQYEAALGGVGVALLPLRVVLLGMRQGKLVHVAKEWSSQELSIYLAFVGRRGMLPSVRALIDYLVEHMPTVLQE
jgi:DNA-binding transcriptional LysR family regulator